MPILYASAQRSGDWQASITAETVKAWADQRFDQAISDDEIDAAAISIVKNGEVILAKGYGLADAVEERSATATTPFRSGSVSKVFTAILILQLAERGLLSLDDDINDHLARGKIDTPKGRTTIRHLITHTAGFDERFRNTLMTEPSSIKAEPSYLRRYAHKQVRAPGEIITYSNHAMGIAGVIVEDVSGLPIGDYIAQNIFEPLGMENAHVESVGKLPDTIAKEHYVTSDRSLAYKQFAYKSPFYLGSGGFFYSATDMAAFSNAVLSRSPALLTSASWDMALTLQKSAGDGMGGGIGLGFWNFEPTLTDDLQPTGKANIFGHSGRTQGFSSILMLFPDEQIGLFISLQKSDFEETGFSFSGWKNGWQFVEAFRGYRQLPDYRSDDAPSLDQFTGTYVENRRPFSGSEILFSFAELDIGRVEIENGQLTWSGNPLRRIGERTFEGLTEYGRPYTISFAKDFDTAWWDATSGYSRHSDLSPILYADRLIGILAIIALSSIAAAIWPMRKSGRDVDVALAIAASLVIGVLVVPAAAFMLGDHWRMESPRFLIQVLFGWLGIVATAFAAWKYALPLINGSGSATAARPFLMTHRSLVLFALVGLSALYIILDVL
ncbi:MAG: serine hydrolase domain-containing protein [Pseudomonadota bacterium]